MTNYPLHSVVYLLLICCAGIAGNIMLIIAYVRDPLKMIKSNSSSYFIFNIAIVDLLSSCLLICNIALSFRGISVPDIPRSITLMLYTVSFTLYLSLAIQRFCSVVLPLWSRVNITYRVCRRWVTTMWLANIVLEIGKVSVTSKTQIKIQLDLATSVLLWMIFFATQCVYIVSCISLRKQNRELQKKQDMNEATERTIRIHLKHQNNFILTIAIVCFISGVSILPELTMTFIISLNATTRSEQATEYVIPSYYVWGLVGFGVNCAIKVFVYIWRLPKYRKTLKKLYCDC